MLTDQQKLFVEHLKGLIGKFEAIFMVGDSLRHLKVNLQTPQLDFVVITSAEDAQVQKYIL